MEMAVVPWIYNNPRIDVKTLEKRSFTFAGLPIDVFQDTDADIGLRQNTELKLWDGGYYLARYIEEMNRTAPGFWRAKRCIELGSGCGLAGIVAWALGANVTLTDLPSALLHTKRVMDHNVTCLSATNSSPIYQGINLKSGSSFQDNVRDLSDRDIRVCAHRWGDNCRDLNVPYDVVIGSDIIYDPELSQELYNSIYGLSSDDTVIILSYKKRGLGEDNFFTLVQENYSIKYETFDPPEFSGSDYKILCLSRSKSA